MTTIETLIHLQKELGLTQEKMANAIGVPMHTYHRWIHGKHKPSAMAMLSIDRFIQKNSQRKSLTNVVTPDTLVPTQ